MDETKLFEKLSEISLCMGILKNQSSEHTKKIEVLFEFYNTSKHLESDFKTRIQTDLVEIKNSIKKTKMPIQDLDTRIRNLETRLFWIFKSSTSFKSSKRLWTLKRTNPKTILGLFLALLLWPLLLPRVSTSLYLQLQQKLPLKQS